MIFTRSIKNKQWASLKQAKKLIMPVYGVAALALIFNPLMPLAKYLPTAHATDGDVVINEVYSHPTSGGDEWVELYSETGSDVSDWVVQFHENDTTPQKTTIGSGTTISAGEHLIVNPDNNWLANGGDTVKLFDADDTLIDSITYPDDVSKPGQNESIGRSPDGSDNWVVFTASQVTEDTENYVVAPEPQLAAEEFTAVNTANYKGISVGFNAKHFGEVTDITVTMERADGSEVVKTDGPGVLNLINDPTWDTGNGKLTTPFFIQEKNLIEAEDKDGNGDLYWQPAPATWDASTTPTKVTIEVTDENGTETVVNENFTEHVSYSSLLPVPTTPYSNGFETDTSGWSGYNGGSISQVPSGSNGIASGAGGFHASLNGESYSNWGGYATQFPADGYTTEVDVYLDMSKATENDNYIDFSSAVNGQDGNHHRDFIFHVGHNPTSGHWSATTGNGSSHSQSNTPHLDGDGPVSITETGWYTLQSYFHDDGSGTLAVDMKIIDSDENVIGSWTLSDPSDVITTEIGGNRYGWFAEQPFTDFAVDNSCLYLGSPVASGCGFGDSTPPEIDSLKIMQDGSDITGGTTNDRLITVQWGSNDTDVDFYEYKNALGWHDMGKQTSFSGNIGGSQPNADGTYTYCVRATDNVGNLGDEKCMDVTLDETAPASDNVTLNGNIVTANTTTDNCQVPGQFYTVNDTINFGADFTDSLSGMQNAKYTVRKVAANGCSQASMYNSGYKTMSKSGDTFSDMFDTTNVPNEDWKYIVHIVGTDKAGNNSERNIGIVVDNTAPDTPIDSKFHFGHTKSGTALACSASDGPIYTNTDDVLIDWEHPNPSDVEYYWFGINNAHNYNETHKNSKDHPGEFIDGNTAYKVDITSANNNPHRYLVTAVDAAGNKSTILETCPVILDQEAPSTPTNLLPDDGETLNSADLFIDWSDSTDNESSQSDIKYEYRLYLANPDTNPGESTRFAQNYTGSTRHPASGFAQGTPEDTYWWRVRACDQANNCSSWSNAWEFTVDNTVPSVQINSPAHGDLVNGTVDIMGNVEDDNPSHYFIRITNMDTGTEVFSDTFDMTDSITGESLYSWDTSGEDDGEYKLFVAARDLADNKDGDKNTSGVSVDSTTVTVDNTAPDVDAGSDDAVTGQSYSLAGTAADATTSVASTLWTQTNGPGTATFADDGALNSGVTVDAFGTYTFELEATDDAGNSATDTVVITFDPPVQGVQTTSQPNSNQQNQNNQQQFNTTSLPQNTNTGNNSGDETDETEENDETVGNTNQNGQENGEVAGSATNDASGGGLGMWWLLIAPVLLGILFFALRRRANEEDSRA